MSWLTSGEQETRFVGKVFMGRQVFHRFDRERETRSVCFMGRLFNLGWSAWNFFIFNLSRFCKNM
jgi:hypothetical protein